VRPGLFILAAVLCSRPALPAQTATQGLVQAQAPPADARLSQALAEVAQAAAAFWHLAPEYVARETLNQKALTLPKRRFRAGPSAIEPPKPEFTHREIVSNYVLSSFRTSSEALHEFREVVSVDGQSLGDAGATGQLKSVNSYDDKAKKALLENFEKTNLAVAATDFGQLILLFTKSNQKKYAFKLRGSELVGADRAMIVDFGQNAGGEALRVAEPGREVREPLTGQIWIRESGFMPLRITLATSRHDRSKTIRDEARVDYQPKADGLVLPVSVVYRRFVNENLSVENIYQYADWKLVNHK
jgi:hypothetical protein